MGKTRNKLGIVNVNDHPLYATWNMMRQRCENPKYTAYPIYGGRGIKVCKRWAKSFEDFVKDIGPKPTKKHTLDRFPNKNGNYEPSNVRWATWTEQNFNRNKIGTFKDIDYLK